MCLHVCVRVRTCVQGPSPGRRLQVMQKYEHTKMKSGLAQLKCKVQLGKDEMSWRGRSRERHAKTIVYLMGSRKPCSQNFAQGIDKIYKKVIFFWYKWGKQIEGEAGYELIGLHQRREATV